MRGVISAIGGPRSACVECLSAIDAIAGRRRRLAPSSKRAVYKEPLNRKLVVDRAAAARRLHESSRLLRRARAARSPWRAAALASTARLLLHAVDENVEPAAPHQLRIAIGDADSWGFVADLLRSPKALALVDELFVELHFFAPSLRWVHLTHSMKQAFDVLRQLRACGLPVHAWP